MKYFAEILAALFVVLTVILGYILYVVVVAAVQEGYITIFATAYALGFVSPVLIYIQSSVFNTAMGAMDDLRDFL
jgi:hypothetical protein